MELGALDDVATKNKAPPKRESIETDLVRRAVDESGLSLREIASRTGVTEKTISRWANGKSGMIALAWPRFLELIGLPEDWPAKKKIAR